MPNIKSAIKRVKTAEKKTLNNNMIKSEYKTAVKKYEAANAEGSKDAAKLLATAKRELDHASSKGVISKNAANRKKSRLEKKLVVAEKKAPAKKAAKADEAREAPKAEKKTEKKTATNSTK